MRDREDTLAVHESPAKDSELTGKRLAWRENSITRHNRAFREKSDRGQREHGGSIWEKPSMLRHAREEVLDLWAYVDVMEYQLQRMAAGLRDGSMTPEQAAGLLERMLA